MAFRSVTVSGITFEVEYDYYPACRGAREKGTGLPLEPDEPESIEINAINSGDDIMDVIDQATIDRIAESIIEELNEPPDDRY